MAGYGAYFTNSVSIAIQHRWKFNFVFNSILKKWFASILCTWHESCATAACAKFCWDLMAMNDWIRTRRSFYRIASKTQLWNGALGWGLLSQFPPFRYFPNFSESQKHTLAIEYHVYIWQVSPQLSCGDTCQIWMWSKESNRYFCKIENFACGEISERSFSNPHTWSTRGYSK